jgi:hypothetical protein
MIYTVLDIVAGLLGVLMFMGYIHERDSNY